MSKLSSSLFDSIPDGDMPTYDQLAQQARSQGFTVQGNRASQIRAGQTYTRDLSTFQHKLIPSFLDQTSALIGAEYDAQQSAADRQFDRNAAAIGEYGNVVSGIPGRVKDAGDTKAIDDLIGQLGAMGSDQQRQLMAMLGEVAGTSKGLYKDTVAGIDRALAPIEGIAKAGSLALNTAAARAEAAGREAINKYDQGINEDVIRSTISGIRADASQQAQMIRAGTAPDGRRLTPAEQAQMTRELRFDIGRQTTQVAATVRAQAQETLAGLRTNLASIILEGGKMRAGASEMEMQGANLKLQGEGLKAQAGDRLTASNQFAVGALLESQSGMRAISEMISGLTQFKSQLKQGMELRSIEMEMNGRATMAQMIQSNPETVISVLSAFLALGSLATAPGATYIKGFNFA